MSLLACAHKRGIGRMSAREANRTRRDGGDVHATSLSAIVTDRAMEAWYHPPLHE